MFASVDVFKKATEKIAENMFNTFIYRYFV